MAIVVTVRVSHPNQSRADIFEAVLTADNL